MSNCWRIFFPGDTLCQESPDCPPANPMNVLLLIPGLAETQLRVEASEQWGGGSVCLSLPLSLSLTGNPPRPRPTRQRHRIIILVGRSRTTTTNNNFCGGFPRSLSLTHCCAVPARRARTRQRRMMMVMNLNVQKIWEGRPSSSIRSNSEVCHPPQSQQHESSVSSVHPSV